MSDRYPSVSQIIYPVETRFEQEPVGVPEYTKFQAATIVAGKEGLAPGELCLPLGAAIEETTHQIFVVNSVNSRIEIFSETGENISQLGVGQLYHPWGITIDGDSVYVTCEDDTVSKLCLTDMSHVKRIGSRGSGNGQFNCPSQLTTDHISRVFITDSCNSRICTHDTNLNHLYNIMFESMPPPYDVIVFLYVLYAYSNPCIYVLTPEGDKLHSLITCGEGIDVLQPCFFCLDPLNNFVISDDQGHSIRVFSLEGNLLHTIGGEGQRQRMLGCPQGIAITPNGRLICVSNNIMYALQIFC